MMKKITLLLALFCGAFVFSQTFTDPNGTYTYRITSESTVEVTSYNKTDKNIVIPSIGYKNEDGYTVTSIGDYAFREIELTSVEIPDTVITIGDGAFWGNDLETVTIPDNVITIPFGAFYQNKLKTVVISDNVTTIGDGAFRENELTSVTIGNSVTTIEKSAFADNSALSYVSISAINPPSVLVNTFANISEDVVFVVPEDSLTAYQAAAVWTNLNVISDTFTEDGYQYIITSQNTVTITDYSGITKDITIPDIVIYGAVEYSVTSIGNDAFASNSLTAVTIPDSVVSIGNGAFVNNKLKTVNIPNLVTNIGESAFASNELTSVNIPDSVTSIGHLVFRNNELTSIVIPNTVTSIGDKAFAFNNNLSFVSISATVLPTISANAFEDSVLLNSTLLVVPDTAVSTYNSTVVWTDFNVISDTFTDPNGTYTFRITSESTVEVTSYNKTDKEIVIPGIGSRNEDGYTVTSIGDSAFSFNQLTSVTIPDSVTSIGNAAFYDNELTEVTIPDSVISIGKSAFRENKLIEVTILNSVTSIDDSAFEANKLKSVDIPDSVISIGNDAFQNNNLTEVTIGSGVTSIGDYAFSNNNGFLTSVISKIDGSTNDILYLGDDVFDDKSNIDLSIPSGAGLHAKYTAANWIDFKLVTQNVTLSIDDIALIEEIDIAFTNDAVTITTSKDIVLQNVVIYNISGVEVAKSNESMLLTTLLTTGVYVLKVTTNKGVVSKKFIK